MTVNVDTRVSIERNGRRGVTHQHTLFRTDAAWVDGQRRRVDSLQRQLDEWNAANPGVDARIDMFLPMEHYNRIAGHAILTNTDPASGRSGTLGQQTTGDRSEVLREVMDSRAVRDSVVGETLHPVNYGG